MSKLPPPPITKPVVSNSGHGLGAASDMVLTALTAWIAKCDKAPNAATVAEMLNVMRATAIGVDATVRARNPAVPVELAFSQEAVTCLECGKAMRTLRKHLQFAHHLTPTGYRDRWGLAHDMPLACGEYMERKQTAASEYHFHKKPKDR